MVKEKGGQEELKAVYRSGAAMYHPDRYASASREEWQNTENLKKKVNKAYERLKPELCKGKGTE
jgi:DnaJ-class molecular chaperone